MDPIPCWENDPLPPLSPATFEFLVDPLASPPLLQETRAPSPRANYEKGIFHVEKIHGHLLHKGLLYLHVEWVGYPRPSDHTFEPVASVTACLPAC